MSAAARRAHRARRMAEAKKAAESQEEAATYTLLEPDFPEYIKQMCEIYYQLSTSDNAPASNGIKRYYVNSRSKPKQWCVWVYDTIARSHDLSIEGVLNPNLCVICSREPVLKRLNADLAKAASVDHVMPTIPAVCTGKCQDSLLAAMECRAAAVHNGNTLDFAICTGQSSMVAKRTSFLDVPPGYSVKNVAEMLPSVSQMATMNNGELGEYLSKYQLQTSLSWIVLVNRTRLTRVGLTRALGRRKNELAYLVNVKRAFAYRLVYLDRPGVILNEDEVEVEDTPFGFVGEIPKSVNFNVPTVPSDGYLWHGSSLGNWFPILQSKIRVLSGSRMMTAGAAHGVGVYLSDLFSFSAYYSSYKGTQAIGARGWHRSKFGLGNFILALCQVDPSTVDKFKRTHNIWVYPEADDVTPKFIITYNFN